MSKYEWATKKAPEKTWPVNIGLKTRFKLLAIINKIKEDTGGESTQRSVVEHAINQLYREVVGELPAATVIESINHEELK